MSYPQNVLPHHKEMYSSNVMLVAQQLRNPLMGAVTEVPAAGEAMSASDLFDKVRYSRNGARSRRNVETKIARDRRWLVRPEDFIVAADYIDKAEKFDTAYDPTSMFVRTFTAAVTRGWADTLLGIDEPEDGVFEVSGTGILGLARSGRSPGAGAPLPSSQFVPHGSTGLTIAKLREVKLALNTADFGLETTDQLYAALTPYQIDDLLEIAETEGTAMTPSMKEELRSGKPVGLMGITWIVTNRLPTNDAGQRLCPVWSKDNIVAGVWQGIQGETWNDTHADNLPYAKVSCMLDAVRLQDKGVVVMECVEPA
jgi:hypothetical protein